MTKQAVRQSINPPRVDGAREEEALALQSSVPAPPPKTIAAIGTAPLNTVTAGISVSWSLRNRLQ